ncbi:MAG: glycosyltransferase family A protein [Gammaproteobacteria bacterium]
MAQAVKVVDVELGGPLTDITGLERYGAVQGLVRLHGRPIGYVQLPLLKGRCSATALNDAIRREHGRAVQRALLRQRLEAPPASEGTVVAEELPRPVVTVAVCTRDRTESLRTCLDALLGLDYPAVDLLVIDNGPSSDASARLVGQYAAVRYVREPRPGLDWARNRAIAEARGEIIAYTDDDVVVDAGWAKALAAVFADDPQVMAVTGLVVPYELETPAQLLFEAYGGFGRGFTRRWYRRDPTRGKTDRFHIGAGRFGTGANMAYRRSLLERLGGFDPALDVGTVTNGGGDLEMFFRVLQEGYTLVYEPAAVVRHRHRRDHAQLRTQLANNGIGLYSYFVRSALAYREMRVAVIRFALWWFWWWNLRRLLLSFVRPGGLPRDLIWAELFGVLKGLVRYPAARRTAARIARMPQATEDTRAGTAGTETLESLP